MRLAPHTHGVILNRTLKQWIRPMLVLHGHPLSTFVMKAAMALYEGGTPFRHAMVNLGDEGFRAIDAIWSGRSTWKYAALRAM